MNFFSFYSSGDSLTVTIKDDYDCHVKDRYKGGSSDLSSDSLLRHCKCLGVKIVVRK